MKKIFSLKSFLLGTILLCFMGYLIYNYYSNYQKLTIQKLTTLQGVLKTYGFSYTLEQLYYTSELQFFKKTVGENLLSLLGEIPHLQKLHFVGNIIKNEDLIFLQKIKSLKSLTIDFNPIENFEFLQYLPQLSELNLIDTKITDESLIHLKFLKSLSSLSLDNSRITDFGLKTISQYCPQLTKLSLRRLSFSSKWTLSSYNITNEGLKYLQNLKKLNEVGFQTIAITDQGLESLLYLPELSILKLQGNYALNFEEMKVIKEPALPNKRKSSLKILTLLPKLSILHLERDLIDFNELSFLLEYSKNLKEIHIHSHEKFYNIENRYKKIQIPPFSVENFQNKIDDLQKKFSNCKIFIYKDRA